MPVAAYRGRFAPSPSGPLHAGSLLAALGSWLDARANGGTWQLRIEDLDTPRNAPGADASILASLEAHGLHWDGAVMRQSQRLEHYAAALARLADDGLAYPCACSRRSSEEAGGRYPGTCREGLRPGQRARAWRLRCPDRSIGFVDRACGALQEEVGESVGDFVLKRADGIYAYQLAVVVDDAAQGITAVVRGRDLLDSTARQCLLQHLLDFPTPSYLHLPLVLGNDGQKLSKQNRAPALDADRANDNLLSALQQLGQVPPPWRSGQASSPRLTPPVDELLAWAVAHWRVSDLPDPADGSQGTRTGHAEPRLPATGRA